MGNAVADLMHLGDAECDNNPAQSLHPHSSLRPKGNHLTQSGDRAATIDMTLFAVLCIVWGLTWIPIKIGTAVIPPLSFAASRFFVAGLIVGIGGVGVRQFWWPHPRAVPRLLAIALLTVTLTYGPLFWGAARVASGLAAVVNLSLIPIGLIAAEALIEKRMPQKRQLMACAVGLPGLGLLFWVDESSSLGRIEGILAIAVGTACYCAGSVLSRKIPTQPSPITVSAYCNTAGAVLLGLWAIALEAPNQTTFSALNGTIVTAWVYLVIFGSVFGFTVYLHLLRVWGSGRAGMYAFLSPIVAVIAGAIALSETITVRDGCGMALMVMGALIALIPNPSAAEGR